MSFSVRPVTEIDMPTVVAIMSDTFGHSQPAIDAIFPSHWTPPARTSIAERLSKRNRSDPLVHHLAIIEDSTQRIVGQATWFMRMPGMVHSEAELAGPYWESEDERMYANELVKAYFARRWRVFREDEGAVFAISSMSVLPEFQGKGAGNAFMQWGIEKADECKAECVVESAIGADGFYAKYGFVRCEDVNCTAEMPAQWQRLGEGEVQLYTWMRRPRR